MKVKKFNNLHLYFLNWDTNKEKPYSMDIFKIIDSERMFKLIKKPSSKYSLEFAIEDRIYYGITDYYELRYFLMRQFMSVCWSRSEFEILVNGLHSDEECVQKIDLWSQIGNNLDLITKLIIQECEIEFKIPDNPRKEELNFILSKEK